MGRSIAQILAESRAKNAGKADAKPQSTPASLPDSKTDPTKVKQARRKGRPMLGDRPLTQAERAKRYRAKKNDDGPMGGF